MYESTTTPKLATESSDNNSSITIPTINEDEFIELIYHIEREELYALKKQHIENDEFEIFYCVL